MLLGLLPSAMNETSPKPYRDPGIDITASVCTLHDIMKTAPGLKPAALAGPWRTRVHNVYLCLCSPQLKVCNKQKMNCDVENKPQSKRGQIIKCSCWECSMLVCLFEVGI